MISRRSNSNLLLSILVTLSTLVYCTPILGNSRNSTIVGLSILFFLLFKLGKSYVHSNRLFLFAFTFYVLLTSLYRILGVSDNYWGNSMHEFSFFLCFVMLLLLCNSLVNNKCRWLFWVISAILIFNIGENIVLSIMFPQINEYRPHVDESLLTTINAGDSTFYTMSMFFAAVCFFVFLNTKEKIIKYLSLSAVVISSVYILGYSNKGSNVVYLLLLLFLLYQAHKSRLGKYMFISIFLFGLLLLVIANIFKEDIVNLILAVSPSERLSTRLITLIDPHNINADQVTVSGRTDLYLLSIKTWLSSPITFLLGVGDVRDVLNPELTGVGQHADILDTLARYGVVGFSLFVIMIKRMFHFIKLLFDKKLRIQVSVIFFVFILAGCTKAVLVPNIGIVLCLLLPITSQFVNKPIETKIIE